MAPASSAATRALAAKWHNHLSFDRRRSAHTVRAYVATAYRLIDFLEQHFGGELGRYTLLNLHAVDLRAFLAERRGGGLGPSSAAREMSAVRAFLRFAAEHEQMPPQLPRTRAPKRPRTLPRPASPDDAVALAEEAGAAGSEPWIGARDLAILLLLYGAGLRVAEALSLTGSVLPIGQALRVTGKRSKTRIVPIIGAVREAIAAYAVICPWPIRGDLPLFVGARGAAPAEPARQPDPARAAPQFRDPFAGARGRPSFAPGIARPRQPVVDPNLHQGRCRAPARRLSPCPSASLKFGRMGEEICRRPRCGCVGRTRHRERPDRGRAGTVNAALNNQNG